MKAMPIITAVCAEQGTATDSRNEAIYFSRDDSMQLNADNAAVVHPNPDMRGSRQFAESPICERNFPERLSRRGIIPDLSRNS